MNKISKFIQKFSFDFLGTIIFHVLILISQKREPRFGSRKFHSILFISEVDKKGGAAKLAYRLHKSLKEKGINSAILSGLITEPEESIYQLKQRDDLFSRILHKIDKVNNWYDFFRLSSFDILNMHIYKDADLIHMHNLHVNYFSKFALPKLTAEKPTIWTLHDTLDLFEDYPDPYSELGEMKTYPSLNDKRRAFLREVSRRIVDNSYLTIVSPSKWLQDKAKRGIFKNKDVRLIYNGVDENVFKPFNRLEIRKELGLPQDKQLLLFSAAWGLADGTKDSKATLLEMYERLKDNEKVFFVILGGSTSEFGKNSLNIPYISDDNLLAKYYSAADLFVYPSLWDNCPLSVLENMGTGTPVITYNTGGIPELVEHMGTGYIAEYNNSSDFANGLITFLSNEDLRKIASKRSREVFEQKFTQTQMINNYLNLYKEIIENI